MADERHRSQTAIVRAEHGRFAVGTVGGPGNPRAAVVEKIRKALLNAVEPAKFKKLGVRLFDMAMDGDVQAARLFLSYTVGPPEVNLTLRAGDNDARTSFRAIVEESFRRGANGHGAPVLDVEAGPSDGESGEGNGTGNGNGT